MNQNEKTKKKKSRTEHDMLLMWVKLKFISSNYTLTLPINVSIELLFVQNGSHCTRIFHITKTKRQQK